MEKRKLKPQTVEGLDQEPVTKKQKKSKQSDTDHSNTNAVNSASEKHSPKNKKYDKKMGKNYQKGFKPGEGRGQKNVKKNQKEKSDRKPVSMQNLLSEKLKKVQAGRLENTTDGKDANMASGTAEKQKGNFTAKNKVNIENQRTVDSKKKNKKNKMDKKKSTKANESMEGVKSASVNTSVQGETGEEEDPEKVAIRKKKREKRQQRKAEKKRVQQENVDKAGTGKKAAVKYLKQWKSNREEWKFLKVRQVWLLQNMYDQKLFDDDSFETLLEYLEGLKGKSRKVTVLEAEKVLEKAEAEGEAEEEEESADVKTESTDVKFDRAKQIIQLLSD